MIPYRVQYFPDLDTIEQNRLGNLSPVQAKFYIDKFNSQQIGNCVTQLIYDPAYHCYRFKDGMIQTPDSISESIEWDGELLPYVNYRIYYLKQTNSNYGNFLSAELIEHTEDILAIISAKLRKALNFSEDSISYNRVGKLTKTQIGEYARGKIIKGYLDIFVIICLFWQILFPHTPLNTGLLLAYSVHPMWFASIISIFTLPFAVWVILQGKMNLNRYLLCLIGIAPIVVLLFDGKMQIFQGINKSPYLSGIVIFTLNWIGIGLLMWCSTKPNKRKKVSPRRFLEFIFAAPIVVFYNRFTVIFLVCFIMFPLVLAKLNNYLSLFSFTTYFAWMGVFLLTLITIIKIFPYIYEEDVEFIVFPFPFKIKNIQLKYFSRKEFTKIIEYFTSNGYFLPGLKYNIYIGTRTKRVVNIELVDVSSNLQ